MCTDLTGQLLIAMPAMADPRFAQSVVFICAHSDDGAMGLIVNKPAPHLSFTDLIEQLGLTAEDGIRPSSNPRVQFGGPVEMTRGFVLHSDDYHSGESTMDVIDGVSLSSTMDVLADMLDGEGPARVMLALGYAGWGPGQLEQEFGQNAWLTAPPREDILFGRAHEHKWSAALKSIGVSPLMLASEAGHA